MECASTRLRMPPRPFGNATDKIEDKVHKLPATQSADSNTDEQAVPIRLLLCVKLQPRRWKRSAHFRKIGLSTSSPPPWLRPHRALPTPRPQPTARRAIETACYEIPQTDAVTVPRLRDTLTGF